jgi:hypothetical protein
MIHRGVRYTVSATVEPDIWQWQFQIGDVVKTGQTKTRLGAMATRRVQLRIDIALRASRSVIGEANYNRMAF